MKTTQEVTMDAFLKLSDELKLAHEFGSFNESDHRIAYLHACAFFENSTNLIAAIEFVNAVEVRLEMDRVGVENDVYEKFEPLYEAVTNTRQWLHTFTDELRAEFDEYRSQPPLRKR